VHQVNFLAKITILNKPIFDNSSTSRGEKLATEDKSMFPRYDDRIVQQIREWCETGRYGRYQRFSRSLEEFLVELGYLIVLQQLEIRSILGKIESQLTAQKGNRDQSTR